MFHLSENRYMQQQQSEVSTYRLKSYQSSNIAFSIQYYNAALQAVIIRIQRIVLQTSIQRLQVWMAKTIFRCMYFNLT